LRLLLGDLQQTRQLIDQQPFSLLLIKDVSGFCLYLLGVCELLLHLRRVPLLKLTVELLKRRAALVNHDKPLEALDALPCRLPVWVGTILAPLDLLALRRRRHVLQAALHGSILVLVMFIDYS